MVGHSSFHFSFYHYYHFIFRYFWMRKSMEAKLQLERMDKERQKK